MTSLASSPNEEMLASWVCVEEKSTDNETDDDQSKYQSYNLGEFLGIPGGGGTGGRPSVMLGDVPELSKKHENQLMDEWINSPDLLVCIHPNNGSLMVWTVEGLDSPRYSTRYMYMYNTHTHTQRYMYHACICTLYQEPMKKVWGLSGAHEKMLGRNVKHPPK